MFGRVLLVTSLVLAGALGCGSATEPDQDSSQNLRQVEGVVTDIATGQPVADCGVKAQSSGWDFGGSRTVDVAVDYTRANGFYRLRFTTGCNPVTDDGMPSMVVVCGTPVDDLVLRCTEEVQVLDISVER